MDASKVADLVVRGVSEDGPAIEPQRSVHLPVKIQGWFKETSDGTKVITSHAPAYDKSWPKIDPKDY